MPKKAYNYDFRMFMEGVQVPFKSIQVMCTPNGVEASINLLSNREVFNLKPKTAVQVFYRDWIPIDGKRGWRLMFDGFLSSYVKNDEALQGRGLAILCRDFRMDIRKAPAALVWQGEQEIKTRTLYNTAGIHQKIVVRGTTPKPKDPTKTEKGVDIRTFDTTGINSLSSSIARIAGTAYGAGLNPPKQKDGESVYSGSFGHSMEKGVRGTARCGLFLDAVVRGVWTEAVGGTAVSTFINKRVRVDKRFLIPKNNTGYEFWSRQTAGLQGGSTIMGNSRFSSVEAAIMRLAGLFSVRVYSCSTPSLISLESDALSWVMDPKVKKFLVDDHAEDFGAKYILNETMLLPPLEFTSPPNCNLFFPPMYDRINWQYDIDADVTRGYFKVVDTLSTKGSNDLKGQSVQVPNALFDIYSPGKKANSKDGRLNAKKDEYGRTKSPITLEERYKGVSVYYGSVEDILARNDANKSWPESSYKPEMVKKIRERESELEEKIKKLKGSVRDAVLDSELTQAEKLEAEAEAKRKEVEKQLNSKIKPKGGGYSNTNTKTALNRHAVLKFLNTRYAGRVAVVDMAFNPYPMSGFPGAIIVDDEAYGGESSKTIIGMVQQVKHLITISPDGGDATTSVVLNNARFEDEPTDLDLHGNPLYMKPTDKEKAEVDMEFNVYANEYFPPDPKASEVRDLDDKYYDLDNNVKSEGYSFTKDVITLSKSDVSSGENNGTYLDNDFIPNRIHKFYKEVFAHKSDHFMLGNHTTSETSPRSIKFAYDTMHEAFVALRENKKFLLNNYEECLKFVSRDICSADAFFQGILGLSVKNKIYNEDGEFTGQYEYTVSKNNYDPERIDDAYFGVTTSDWNSNPKVQGLKASTEDNPGGKGLMTEAGQFSSIKEHLPLTAFIQERRDAVQSYKDKVKERVEGVQFANIERYKTNE